MCHTICAPQKLQNKCVAKISCNLEDLVTLTEEGGAVALWLVRSTLEQLVRVGALARDIVVFLGKTLYSHGASLHPGV